MRPITQRTSRRDTITGGESKSPRLVAYFRVSTARQGRSGLGLDAQERAVQDYARSIGGEVLATFTEIESGRHNDRPQLRQALALADVTGATLVIAKLDRLSRNAAFLLTLRDSGVRFVAADMPDANDLTVGIMAVVAQSEREAISRRTKEALRAAKARGVHLGNPNGAAALRRAGRGNRPGSDAASRMAAAHAAKVLPLVAEMRAQGIGSLGAIADQLNSRNVQTLRGKQWHRSSVANLLARASDD